MSNKFLDYQGLETVVTNIKDKTIPITQKGVVNYTTSLTYTNIIESDIPTGTLVETLTSVPTNNEISSNEKNGIHNPEYILINENGNNYYYMLSEQIPDSNNLQEGEIVLSIKKGYETLFFKNDNNDIVSIKSIDKMKNEIENIVNRLMTDTELKFYCIEPVTIKVIQINGNSYVREYPSNTLVDIFLNSEDNFELVTTSDYSILNLSAWPGALNTYYSWLEGVQTFNGILFDMNTEEMYTKWSQGNQLDYHVQKAQYKDCVFWSDLPYISDVTKRTNYTLLSSSEAPLCYSTIPENTFKAFYLARGINNDPNWSNPLYLDSFSKANWATQAWSYYGGRNIGIAMDDTAIPIKLPKDCRGLCFASNTIQNIGTLDAINVTNFGYRTNSWACAFAGCYSLEQIYIINLNTHINFAWSPIIPFCIQSIIDNAINTSNLNIHVSSWTYNRLPQSTFDSAKSKKITIIEGSPVEAYFPLYSDDKRLQMLQLNGDGNSYLSNDGTYKTLSEYVTNNTLETKVNEAIAALVNNAPETLDTLGEIATALKENDDVVSVLNAAIGNKSDVGHIHDDRYILKDEIEQLIKQGIEDYFNENPDEPEEPTGSIGSITEDNSIVIDETQLENGTYTLKYIDSNENIIDNFNEITSFEINK